MISCIAPGAEVAFSVEKPFVNRGIATQLMGRVIRTARNRGLRHLILVCLPDNAKMQAIARHYGAEIKVEDGSVIADIIPKDPDYQSWVGELLDERNDVPSLRARFPKATPRRG